MEPIIPKIPSFLICPISNVLFKDPVIAGDGHTYERQDIQRWLTKFKISPMTRKEIGTALLQKLQQEGRLYSYEKIQLVGSKIKKFVQVGILQELKSLLIGEKIIQKRKEKCQNCSQLEQRLKDQENMINTLLEQQMRLNKLIGEQKRFPKQDVKEDMFQILEGIQLPVVIEGKNWKEIGKQLQKKHKKIQSLQLQNNKNFIRKQISSPECENCNQNVISLISLLIFQLASHTTNQTIHVILIDKIVKYPNQNVTYLSDCQQLTSLRDEAKQLVKAIRGKKVRILSLYINRDMALHQFEAKEIIKLRDLQVEELIVVSTSKLQKVQDFQISFAKLGIAKKVIERIEKWV